MFDEDNSGQIDEDEFFFLLQYLGLDVSASRLNLGSPMCSRLFFDENGVHELELRAVFVPFNVQLEAKVMSYWAIKYYVTYLSHRSFDRDSANPRTKIQCYSLYTGGHRASLRYLANLVAVFEVAKGLTTS